MPVSQYMFWPPDGICDDSGPDFVLCGSSDEEGDKKGPVL